MTERNGNHALCAVARLFFTGCRNRGQQFFLRFVIIFTVYKLYDMICFDYFLLMKFHFFQHYFPEVRSVYPLKKYGFNLKSQLLKLLVIFPAASALTAWLCALL